LLFQNETLFGRREKKAAFYGSPEDKKLLQEEP
jgi:hypothetical protein